MKFRYKIQKGIELRGLEAEPGELAYCVEGNLIYKYYDDDMGKGWCVYRVARENEKPA